MANKKDIKQYLLSGDNPYFEQDNRNGQILMLSGVWGSGKTHFWKNEMEDKLIESLEKKEKSYVFVSLYGKDSIEELQNEIYQLAYNFSVKDANNIISSASSVFTKVAGFMPKVSLFGLEIELADSAQKIETEKYRQQVEKGIVSIKDGGIICFDDFERKSSKIDLNDLFGFITNLTEIFKTKTVIIINQESFKENDSEVFSKIKEKSINKFLLFNPTVDELFESIYKEKYTELDDYKDKILEAIKVTEEKNARIFIQVLDNCLEYKENAENENENDIFMLVLITVLFVKYNLIFRMIKTEFTISSRSEIKFLPSSIKEIPNAIETKLSIFNKTYTKKMYINRLIEIVEKDTNFKNESIKYIDDNKNMLYQLYKYHIKKDYFKEKDKKLIEKLNNFVESGILK